MLNILRAPTNVPNEAFQRTPRVTRQRNVAWLAEHAKSAESSTHVVLVGGVDEVAFRLRIAQAHARDTFDPSTWSHVFFAAPPPFDPGTTVVEIPPLSGIARFPPPTNGVQKATLRKYDDPRAYPNIALLVLPVAWAETLRCIELFMTQRAVLDALDLMVRWLAFVWGAGRAGNPLLDGFGIPSAALVEVVMSAAGFDLTPNVPNRASYPEAIWQSAKWWQEHQQERQQLRINGVWTNEHRFGPVERRKGE